MPRQQTVDIAAEDCRIAVEGLGERATGRLPDDQVGNRRLAAVERRRATCFKSGIHLGSPILSPPSYITHGPATSGGMLRNASLRRQGGKQSGEEPCPGADHRRR